jgi:hypothetical protein
MGRQFNCRPNRLPSHHFGALTIFLREELVKTLDKVIIHAIMKSPKQMNVLRESQWKNPDFEVCGRCSRPHTVNWELLKENP